MIATRRDHIHAARNFTLIARCPIIAGRAARLSGLRRIAATSMSVPPLDLELAACTDAAAHPQHGHRRTTCCTTCSVRSPGMCTPQHQTTCPDTTAPGPRSRVPFLPSTRHTSCRLSDHGLMCPDEANQMAHQFEGGESQRIGHGETPSDDRRVPSP